MKKTGSTKSGRNSVEQRLFRHWREFLERSNKSLDTQDELKLQIATQRFREQVEEAAADGFECSVTWFSLGLWSFDNEERILCFGRTLKCIAKEEVLRPAADALGRWTFAHYNALCRFEIARALANEGRRNDAKAYLEEALPFARLAEDMAEKDDTFEGNLEGRIAGELMLLDVKW